MKKLIKIFALLIIASSLFLSCSKKYPEDGIYYIGKSPEKRIGGTWRLTKYYINGADSTNVLFDKYIGIGDYRYGILDFRTETKSDNKGWYGFSIPDIGAWGGFLFKNDENYLEIGFSEQYALTGSQLYDPFTNNDPTQINLWKIQELTGISFKIDNTINNTTYHIEFSKL